MINFIQNLPKISDENIYNTVQNLIISNKENHIKNIVLIKDDNFNSALLSSKLLFKLCKENISLKCLYSYYRKNNPYNCFRELSKENKFKQSYGFLSINNSSIKIEDYKQNLWTCFNSMRFNLCVIDDGEQATENNLLDINRVINGISIYFVNKKDQYKFWENKFIQDQKLITCGLKFKTNPDKIQIHTKINSIIYNCF